MEVWVLICRLLPILCPFFHGRFNEPRIISWEDSIPELKRIRGWRLSNSLHPSFSLVVDVLKLDSLIKVNHALSIILLLVGDPRVDCIALRRLGTHHLVIDVLALNYVGHLLHEFVVVLS